MVVRAAHSSAQHGHAPFSAWFPSDDSELVFDAAALAALAARPRETVHIVTDATRSMIGAATGGVIAPSFHESDYHLLGTLPPLFPEWLGDRAFTETHSVRFPLVVSGVIDTFAVAALAEHDVLSFYETNGRTHDRIVHDIGELIRTLAMRTNWGVTIHHGTNANDHARLFVKYDVPHVAVMGFDAPTAPLVHLATKGLHLDHLGRPKRRTSIHVEVTSQESADLFMHPADATILHHLVEEELLNQHEAELAARVPLAVDIVVASDNPTLFQNTQLAAARVNHSLMYTTPVRVGAQCALTTPCRAANAFGQGASFIHGIIRTDHAEFQQWTTTSFLDHPAHATPLNIVRNVMEGAAVLTRAQQLRSAGLPVHADAFSFVPRELS